MTTEAATKPATAEMVAWCRQKAGYARVNSFLAQRAGNEIKANDWDEYARMADAIAERLEGMGR